MSHLFHLALNYEIQGLVENPAKGIKPYEENNQRQRFITKKETKRLMQEISQSENTHPNSMRFIFKSQNSHQPISFPLQ